MCFVMDFMLNTPYQCAIQAKSPQYTLIYLCWRRNPFALSHMNILPRWLGDTNFLPTLAGTKQISFDLHHIYKQLKPSFEAIEQECLF